MEAFSSGQEQIETRTRCWQRWLECRGRAVLEYARNFVTVVYPQRHGLGEHFSKDVGCNAEGSATHGASLSPGVPGCDVGQSYSACWRLAALDKIHNAIRSSPLLCFASCPGRQCADMILPAKLLMETSRMWPDTTRPDQVMHKEGV